MLHRADSRLRAMRHSTEFFAEIFDHDSLLCCTAQSRLHPIRHSGEALLCALRHSMESHLRAMPHSAESQPDAEPYPDAELEPDAELDLVPHPEPDPAPHLDPVLVPDTKPDKLVCGFSLSKSESGTGSGFIVQIYCDSVLCCIAQSSDSTLCGIAGSRYCAMPHRAESTHIREYLGKIETQFKNILGR
jgi:hypothetical protein